MKKTYVIPASLCTENLIAEEMICTSGYDGVHFEEVEVDLFETIN